MLWPFRVSERPTFHRGSYYSSNGRLQRGLAFSKTLFLAPRLHEAETTSVSHKYIIFLPSRYPRALFTIPLRYMVSLRAVNAAVNNCTREKVILEKRWLLRAFRGDRTLGVSKDSPASFRV